MGAFDFLKSIGSLLGESFIDDFKVKVDKTMDDVKVSVEQIVEMVIRKTIAFFLLLIGLIFGLVGLSRFLTQRVPAFSDGIGYVVVGLVLILLAWFASYMNKS